MSQLAQAAPLIRDSEMDFLLQSMLDPMLVVANLPENYVRVQVVHDPSLNAFVTDGNRMYIHTGLILASESPEMLASVMAHELGHIDGGHLLKRKMSQESRMLSYTLTALLAGLAGAAGSGQAATGVLAAGAQWHMANAASYSRSQEQAADQAALRYMDATNVSTRGMLTMFETLQRENMNPLGNDMPYMRSHPLTVERVAHVRQHVSGELLPQTHPWVAHLGRIQAKIVGFLLPLDAHVDVKRDDDKRLVEAVRAFRRGDLPAALVLVRGIEGYAHDPYVRELEAQFRAESGDVAGAVPIYREILRVMPQPHAVTDIAFVQALLALDTDESVSEAYERLRFLSNQSHGLAALWPLMARAAHRVGDEAAAYWAKAETALMQEHWKDAKRWAQKAIALADAGSAIALRAMDVKLLAETKINE